METIKDTARRQRFALGTLASRAGSIGFLAALVCPLACGPTGEHDVANEPVGETGQQESALIVKPEPSDMGTLVHVAPVTAQFTRTTSGWALIPGLAGAVQSAQGDNLQIRVSAEMFGGATAYLRAKVDGVGLPWVIFKRAGESSDEVRDFTFVAPTVGTGQHIVEIEWWATDDVTIRARSMTIESLPAKLSGVATGAAEYTKTSDTWEDVPGLSTSLTTTATQDFAITFSADSVAESGRMLIRALVDDDVVSEVAFVEAGSGSRFGARSYTFVRKFLGAGTHPVRLQWRVEGGGKARLGPRTLAVTAGRPTGAAGLEADSLAIATPKTYTSTEFVTVMNDAFTTYGANSSAILSFGAEIKATGRAYLRTLVDGTPTSDAPVQLAHGGGSFRVASYAFRATNLGPGRHKVAYQLSVEGGKTATLNKKYHRVLYRPRSGAELVRPLDNMKPRQQRRTLLAICFDPMRPGHPAPSKETLQNVFEGVDGDLSVKGWFDNNSRGRLTFDSIRYVGCEDGNWLLPPPQHRGNWYWDNKAWDVMWREALQAADGQVDFHAYDLDGNHTLSFDEVGVMIIRPQDTAYGTVRGTTATLDGKKLNVQILDLYLSANAQQRRNNVGLSSHEMCHAFLDAWDLHSCSAVVAPREYSIMHEHGRATSLDPFHKLKSGWVMPSLLDIASATARTFTIPSVSAKGEVLILQDRARGDGEYFILENRSPHDRYDAALSPGVQVWHVFEDKTIDAMYPPLGSENCPAGRTRIRRLTNLNNVSRLDLVFADGTSTGVRLRAIGEPASSVDVSLERL